MGSIYSEAERVLIWLGFEDHFNEFDQEAHTSSLFWDFLEMFHDGHLGEVSQSPFPRHRFATLPINLLYRLRSSCRTHSELDDRFSRLILSYLVSLSFSSTSSPNPRDYSIHLTQSIFSTLISVYLWESSSQEALSMSLLRRVTCAEYLVVRKTTSW